MSKDKENLCLFPVKYSFQLLFGLNKHTMKWFFNDIAEANTHRIVVLPKNSYQGLLARNELEQADRRVHQFVRHGHMVFISNERSSSTTSRRHTPAKAVPCSRLSPDDV